MLNDEKLQKVLARTGLGSRREMEKVIAAGRVTVNGEVANLGARVKAADKVAVDGRIVQLKSSGAQPLRVLLYNKPEGEICSRSDPDGRPTVFAALPRLKEGRWISVGRLDINTSGLLLFTNEGELAHKLMHPSTSIDREYLVRVRGEVDDDMLQRLREGVLLEDGMAKFSDIVPNERQGTHQWFYCVLMEGRNREVRRLWESQDVQVSRLKRVRFGNVFIPSHVRTGQWIELDEAEVQDLYRFAGLPVPQLLASRNSRKEIHARKRQQRRLRSGGKKSRLKR